MRSFGKALLTEHQILAGDLSASNTLENPDKVKPRFAACAAAAVEKQELELEPKSFHLFKFALKAASAGRTGFQTVFPEPLFSIALEIIPSNLIR